ncbi:MAG: response regulator [Desulfobacteraceae bacterium]|nr:response regulator [Desulfobacteraceae bacterium]
MKILVADDDTMTRLALTKNLEKSGYEVVSFEDGKSAFDALSGEKPPRLAILDWIMPGMEGIEICRELNDREGGPLIYTILLTVKNEKKDIIKALDSGACDFLSKPVHSGELHSRIAVGLRLLNSEDRLLQYTREVEDKNRELEKALSEIKTLSGLLPICGSCKKIRDDEGYWNQIEIYIESRSDALFSHGLCPECLEKLYGDQEWFKKRSRFKKEQK